MRLTRYTDYTLRVLIFLGLRGEQVSTIREIAQHYGISENHLMKVVHRLGQRGLIQTLRGRKGGLLLAVPAERINIGEVVRWSEEDLVVVECFDMVTNTCPIAGPCLLQHVLNQALHAFFAVLDRYTLADLLKNGRVLAQRLGLTLPEVPESRA
ncbi:MAG: Rrf2 family transcriptional regulator [Kiloniellales bacterium]|nr:Rrf2 family transcriptional regulator [Kiloniellales bacterium]